MSINFGAKIPNAMVSATLGDAYVDQGNQMLRAIQALVQANVKNMTTTAPPGSPADGDTYIVAGSPSGAWTGKAGKIAYWAADPSIVTPAWDFHTPVKGWLVCNQSDGLIYVYSGSSWVALAPVMSSTVGGLAPTPPNDAKQFLDGTGVFSTPVPRAVASINAQTASYTLVITDAGAYVRMNVGSANNLTVPPNSSVAFAVGTVITVRQVGAGVTTIVAGVAVTINSPSSLAIGRQNGTVQLIKVASDTWDLIGDVT